MFERTRRKIAFNDEGRRYAVYALTHYHNDLASREGFTDRVDDLMSRIAERPVGKKMTIKKNDFDLLMYALALWYEASKSNAEMPHEDIRLFIRQLGDTPDMTGKTYWSRGEVR